MRRASWDRIAYVARYGKQQIDQLYPLTVHRLLEFHSAICRLVEQENSIKK